MSRPDASARSLLPAPPQSEDDRLASFADLVRAIDHRDVKGMLAATKTLRALGLSVVVMDVPSRDPGGRR